MIKIYGTNAITSFHLSSHLVTPLLRCHAPPDAPASPPPNPAGRDYPRQTKMLCLGQVKGMQSTRLTDLSQIPSSVIPARRSEVPESHFFGYESESGRFWFSCRETGIMAPGECASVHPVPRTPGAPASPANPGYPTLFLLSTPDTVRDMTQTGKKPGQDRTITKKIYARFWLST